MSRQLTFLGWDKPWSDLFSDWLAQDPDLLRHRLVVVPTRESGRRLRELLVTKVAAHGRGAILGPRVATPDDFFRPDQPLPDAIRWAGWLEVLRQTGDGKVASLFPGGLERHDDAWRLAVVQQIEKARELLISGNVRFTEVAGLIPEDGNRWQELAQLEQRVLAQWQQWGFVDPVSAKQNRALNPERPRGVKEVVVAGVADPTQLAVEAWRRIEADGIPITVLVGAPKHLKHAFDDWGRPNPEFWSDRNRHTAPEPGRSLVAADAFALADAVVHECTCKSNQAVAVGICDSAFLPAVSRRFKEAGWDTFDPEGVALAKDGWPELLEALACALETPSDHAAVVRVARHPVAWSDWLKDFSARATLAALGKWELEECTADIDINVERLRGSKVESEKAAGELLAKVSKFIAVSGQSRADRFEAQLRKWFQEAESEVAERAFSEMDSWSQLRSSEIGLPLRLRWLAASLASTTRSRGSVDAALPLQGWLELPFDPAPHLILAALHEGSVPEAVPADPLVSQALCERLNLRDRRSRLAREVFLYTAMIEGRRANGSVTVVTSQVNTQGEPCRPSRVLLQARKEALPARVLKWVKEDPDVPRRPTPAWSRGEWKLRLRDKLPRNREWKHLSPSTLKAYLACPTHFYFERVLNWDEFEPFAGELDARGFGELIHGVLCDWGNDATARECDDAVKLRKRWLDLLRARASQQFGKHRSSLIQLQLLSAEERLSALAERQAEQRQLGWQVVAVEREFNGVLLLSGIPLRLRIDRIDRHVDGRLRVIDYKTGKTAEDPLKAHLRTWSAEKCPPALGELCPVAASKGRERMCGWADLQLPLYAATVKKEYAADGWPEAWYALLPASVSDTKFVPFEKLDEKVDNALHWAEEAARRIVAGVFWPPAPEVKYDSLAAIAPEGLPQALGGEWQEFLAGPAQMS